MQTTKHHQARRGNAIVMALAVFTVAAMLVTTAADSAITTAGTARQITYQQQALAALDTVLARHQVDVVGMATLGDPTIIANVDQWKDGRNYGADFIGDVEVRWKVEPVCTPPNDPTPVLPTYPDGSPINFITNPSPDSNWVTPTSRTNWQANDNNYMFRISAEARVGTSPNGEPLAMVQGARYASVNKEPLFRYVIFYAQQGPKGDLELTHADPVKIQGAVHTNGALYIGSGGKVNDKMARLGSIDGNFHPSSTIIGPDAPDAPKTPNPVRVNGVNGIFRISKPLMYSIINGYGSLGLLSDGSNPGSFGNAESSSAGTLDWTASGSYSLVDALYPTETVKPLLSSVQSATNYGQNINPYRILSQCGAITENLFTGLVYNADGTSGTGADNWRTICNKPGSWVPLFGMSGPGGAANDARDFDRPLASSKWKVASLLPSAPGFNGMARTKETGQGVKRLPSVLANQGLEPQTLTYFDYDGNPLTDQHEYARPKFMKADGSQTTDFPYAPSTGGWPNWGGKVAVEACGQYLRYALGVGDAYMGRFEDGTGWFVRKLNNTIPDSPTQPGLIIRERPIPDTAYWPGASGGSIVDSNDLHWLPFAYGKQWYPNIAPFTVADVSDQLYYAGDSLNASRINTSAANRVVSYAAGGRLTVTTAQTSCQTFSSPYTGVGDYNYTRYPYYYGGNWRFIHLKKADPTTTTGLLLTAFNDLPNIATPVAQSGSATPSMQSLCSDKITLTAPASGISPTVTISTTSPTPVLTGYKSARFEGFITPPSTGTYEFTISIGSSQGCRVWVNGNLLYSYNWGASVNSPQRLTGGVPLPFQVDWCNYNNATPTLGLYWHTIDTSPAPAFVSVPSSAFTTRSALGFPKSEFTAVEMRIDRPAQISATPAQAKIGLMIRDAVTGMSPLANGSGPYLFLGWSPTRGFFTERRLVRHLQDSKTVGVYYIGNGTDNLANPADALGQIGITSTTTGASRSSTITQVSLTPVAYGAPVYGGPTNGANVDSTVWTSPTAFSGTMSRDVGGGKIWTIIDAFSTGAVTGTRTYQPKVTTTASVTGNQTQVIQINGQVAPLNESLDAGKTFTVYSALTGGTTLANGSASLTYNASIAANTTQPTATGTWYFFGGATNARTQLKRYYANTVNATPNVALGSTYTFTTTVGSATTVWGSPRINKNGTVTTATLSDINTVTGMSFTAQNPSKTAPALSGIVYPTAPAYPTAPTGSPPGVAVPTATTTFQVQRSGGTVKFDLNSFVSGADTWFATAAAAYMPWCVSPFTAWNGIVPPTTQGFRPDAWSGAAAPAAPPTVATAYTGLTGTLNPANISPNTTGWRMADDVKPASLATATEVWLRIEQSGSPAKFHFKYFIGTTKPTGPTDPGWTELNAATAPADLSGWGTDLLVGPALQSGDVNTSISATLTNLKVTTTAASPNDVIDATDWDGGGTGAGAMVKYMCSQYQVFWGPREITEDFFKWVNPTTGTGIATEDWIWNPREFWSQSRWWDFDYANGTTPALMVEKDIPVNPKTTFNSTTIREALSKVTMLSLDMRNLQDYLASRSLSQAVTYMTGGVASGANAYNSGWPVVAAADDYVLKNKFSGLIYAVRTNRYPWNPNIPKLVGGVSPLRTAIDNNAAGGGSYDGINPWSPSYDQPMPNSAAQVDTITSTVADRNNLSNWAGSDLTIASGVHKLQPYTTTVLPEAPALKPQEFHHGIRILNGSSIDWGYPGTKASAGIRSIGSSGTTATTWNWSPAATFGASKTSIVTPNPLVVQGNLNVDQHNCTPSGGGSPIAKFTPLAIMGDSVTLLSNNWNDANFQVPGMTITNTSGAGSVSGTGTLAASYYIYAKDTEMNAAIATHNQPTTRERVAEGQAAPFTDSIQLLENWNTRTMSYLGSLVVMDSRRYTRSFLLDQVKSSGQTPFGIIGSSTWLSTFNGMMSINASGTTVATPLYGYTVTAADWLGQPPLVCSDAVRVYRFNYDLTTPEGTPPFAPFGVSSAGIGGWARAVR